MAQPIVRPQQRTVEGKTEMRFNRPAQGNAGTKPKPAPLRPPIQRALVVEESSSADKAMPLKGEVIPPKAHSEVDPDYVDITLPSNFYFYPFKSLSVKPVRANAQAKFNRAAKEGRMKHLVDAISSCIEPGRSAYELTPQDFHSIMYWLRLNSYGKTPMTHKTVCENKEHIDDVVEKRKPVESLNISAVITKTSLTETQFDPEKMYQANLPNGLRLGYLTMRDVVDVSEMVDDENFDEIEWYADLAGFLAPRTEAEISIKSRIELVKNLSPDDVEEIIQYSNSITDYGVKEKVLVRCNGCGAEMESNISIDALTFLPTSR